MKMCCKDELKMAANVCLHTGSIYLVNPWKNKNFKLPLKISICSLSAQTHLSVSSMPCKKRPSFKYLYFFKNGSYQPITEHIPFPFTQIWKWPSCPVPPDTGSLMSQSDTLPYYKRLMRLNLPLGQTSESLTFLWEKKKKAPSSFTLQDLGWDEVARMLIISATDAFKREHVLDQA